MGFHCTSDILWQPILSLWVVTVQDGGRSAINDILQFHQECVAVSINTCPWSNPVQVGILTSPHPYCMPWCMSLVKGDSSWEKVWERKWDPTHKTETLFLYNSIKTATHSFISLDHCDVPRRPSVGACFLLPDHDKLSLHQTICNFILLKVMTFLLTEPITFIASHYLQNLLTFYQLFSYD